MLDVHPPHSPTHTWRDFLIHIATIVVGLCIAVGLEQTVELLHHRHQVAETRESLRAELEENRLRYNTNTSQVRLNSARFQNDLLVLLYLQQHPGTPEEKLPGILIYNVRHAPAQTAAWATAQRTGVTELLPREEVAQDDSIYQTLALSDERSNAIWALVNKALSYRSLGANPSRFTTAQLDEQIKLTQDLVTANVYWGYALQNLHDDYPAFAPGPTSAELDAMRGPARTPEDTARLADATRLTNARTQQLQNDLKAKLRVQQEAHPLAPK